MLPLKEPYPIKKPITEKESKQNEVEILIF